MVSSLEDVPIKNVDVVFHDWLRNVLRVGESDQLNPINSSARVYPRQAKLLLTGAQVSRAFIKAFVPQASCHMFDTTALVEAAYKHAYLIQLSTQSSVEIISSEQPALIATFTDVLPGLFECEDVSMQFDSSAELNALIVYADCCVDHEASFKKSFSTIKSSHMGQTLLLLDKPIKVASGRSS